MPAPVLQPIASSIPSFSRIAICQKFTTRALLQSDGSVCIALCYFCETSNDVRAPHCRRLTALVRSGGGRGRLRKHLFGFITLREVVNRGRGGRHQVDHAAVDGGPFREKEQGESRTSIHFRFVQKITLLVPLILSLISKGKKEDS